MLKVSSPAVAIPGIPWLVRPLEKPHARAATAPACDLEHRQERLAGNEVSGLRLGTGQGPMRGRCLRIMNG